jgi:hypothetical protein
MGNLLLMWPSLRLAAKAQREERIATTVRRTQCEYPRVALEASETPGCVHVLRSAFHGRRTNLPDLILELGKRRNNADGRRKESD